MAASLNQHVIEEIRSRTDIVEVIHARVPLRRAGSGYTACCPFHKEKTPSFHVNPSRQMYKCFGCGEAGDVFAFLQKHDGLTFGDALRMLGERCGVKVSFEPDDGREQNRKRLLEIHAEVAAFYRRCLLQMKEAQQARDYLASRDLPAEIAEQFQIGYAPATRDALSQFATAHRYSSEEMVAAGLLSVVERNGRNALHDRFRGRLMFPINDPQGRVVAFSGRILVKDAKAAKYVNSPETAIFIKSRTLYALDKAQRHIVAAPNRQALVCEGQIDTIRCHAAGYPTAVASQGTAFTEEHVALLKRYADSAVLVFDPDTAGQKAAVRTSGLFLAAGVPVRIARLPAGEDPDSFLRKQGPDAFRAVLAAAEEVVPFQARLLQAVESDPSSADALGRISRGLLETVRQCGNAVHRARMLQEAAAILNLPENALGEELDRAMEAEARRVATRQGFQGGETSRRQAELDAQSRQELNEILIRDDDLPATLEIDVDGAGHTDPAARTRPTPEEYALCELLVHNLENEKLVGFVEEHLLPELILHPYCQALARALFETSRTDTDALVRLQEHGDPGLVDFIGGVIRSPDRSGHGEFTELEAAKDLVLGLWRQRLQKERDALRQGGSSAELDRQSALLGVELRALRQWDTGVHVIIREKTRAAGGALPAPATPAAHEAPLPYGESDGAGGTEAPENPPEGTAADAPDSDDNIPPEW